jgi:hypothetical protein
VDVAFFSREREGGGIAIHLCIYAASMEVGLCGHMQYSVAESRVLRAQHTWASDDGKIALLSVFYDGQSKTREWLAECSPTLAATSLSAQRWGRHPNQPFSK